MKNKISVSLIVLVICFTVIACASSPSSDTGTAVTTGAIDQSVTPGPDESIIIVYRGVGAPAVRMHVWFDGEEAFSLGPNGSSVFTVKNGEHTIQAGSSNVDKGGILTFAANSEQITIGGSVAMGVWSARFTLSVRERLLLPQE